MGERNGTALGVTGTSAWVVMGPGGGRMTIGTSGLRRLASAGETPITADPKATKRMDEYCLFMR